MPEHEHSKKIPLVVFGTDQKGEAFQEDTSTLQVARTWAKIRLRHVPQAGSDLLIFNKENGNQAEFVFESATGANEAKLLLRDHSVDIWQLDFGVPAEPAPDLRPRWHLVCVRCGTRESVPLESAEVARLEASGRVMRHCPQCVAATEWQMEMPQAPTEAAPPEPARAAVPAAEPSPDSHAELLARLEEALRAEAKAPAVAEQPQPIKPPAVAEPEPPAPAPPAPTAVPPAAPQPAAAPEISWMDRRSSRRIQLRTRARVRRASSSEIVQPVNVSRGGICFESRAAYELDEVVWVAMHYREGGEAMETPSRIVRITRMENTGFNYGVRFD